jgi:phosphatidylcholine synthase
MQTRQQSISLLACAPAADASRRLAEQTCRLNCSGRGFNLKKKGHSAGEWNVLRFYTMPNNLAKPSRKAAWLVHVYTALGMVLGFVGAWGVVHGHDRLALASMFVATLVDATDGMLARRFRVKEALPDVDGARIDDIVDYITFVFLPMLLLEASGGLYLSVALPVIAIVLLSSMYGFVAPDAKSSDHFFTGFPSYWNIVVLYLMLFRVPPFYNALVLLALSALVFVRIGYVYPSRTPTLRTLTLALGAVWTVLVGAIIWMWPSPPRAIAIASLAFPVYYTVLSLVLHARRRPVTAPVPAR